MQVKNDQYQIDCYCKNQIHYSLTTKFKNSNSVLAFRALTTKVL